MTNTPTNPVVEILVDGEWIDVIADCRQGSADSGGGIHIKRGRANEAPFVEPTELEFTLNNGESKVAGTLGQQGVYSERNPNGPYWGKLGRNLPVRVASSRVTDPFARTVADGWGATPDWTDSLDQVQPGRTWRYSGTVWNFDTTGSAATLQADSTFQSATFGSFTDVDIVAKVRVSDRTSEFGLVMRSLPLYPSQPDGTFETDTTGQWAGTSCTVAHSTAQAKHGTGSMLLTTTGTPTDAYVQPGPAYLAPVTEGETYKVRSFARLGVVGNWRLAIHWYDAAKAFLSSSFSGNFATAGGWGAAQLSATAPAGAAYAGYGPAFVATPGTGVTMHVDEPEFMQTSNVEMYTVTVHPDTTDSIRVRRVSPGSSLITTSALTANIVAGVDYWIQGQIAGQRVRARIWADGDPVPDWRVTRFSDQTPYVSPIAMVGEAGLYAEGGSALVTFDSVEFNVWRAHAEITQLPPRWDLSRTDHWVPVQARGLLQRLGQGRKALDSAVTLHLAQYTPTYAWLRLEAGVGDGVVSNAAPGGYPGQAVNVSFSSPELTGVSALPGVAGYAHLDGASSSLTVQVPSHGSGTAWTVLVFFQIPANPASDIEMYRVSTSGTARVWRVFLQLDGAVRVEARAADNTLLDSDVGGMHGAADMPLGGWLAGALYCFQDGSDVEWAWNYHHPGADNFYSVNGTLASATLGRVTQFTAQGSAAAETAGGLSLAQVFHYVGDLPFVTSAFARAAAAYDQETALDRFSRLCTDAGVKWSRTGPISVTTEPMGPQLPAKRMELLEEIAYATGGLIMESRDAPNTLELVTRQGMYNPEITELDIDAGHLSSPLEPTPDDQGTRNDVTVHQKSTGLFAVSVQETGPLNINPPEEDPQGVGVYDEGPELNLGDVDDIQPAANWRRSIGTQPDPRYPSVRVDLASSAYQDDPELTALVLGLDSGRAVRIVNPEVSPDPYNQIVQSYTEHGNQFDWDLTFVAAPATVHTNIGVVEANARVGPSNSVVETPFDSGTDTALSVETGGADAELWVTTADDADVTGFDIMVDGVRLTVVSISGSSDPQTITVEQVPVNGVIKTIAPGSKIEMADAWTVAW